MKNEKLSGYPSIDKPWLKYYPKYIIEEDILDRVIEIEVSNITI